MLTKTITIGDHTYHLAWSAACQVSYAKMRGLEFMDEVIPDMMTLQKDGRMTAEGMDKIATFLYVANDAGYYLKKEANPYDKKHFEHYGLEKELIDGFMYVTGLDELVKAVKEKQEQEEEKKTSTEKSA